MLDAQIVGYLLSYRVNGSGNVWMLRFDTEEQAQAHIKKVGLDVPTYQCVVNPIVEMATIEEPKGLPMWRRR
jgi:hypothetical protein